VTVMHVLSIFETLLFYDVPELFVAHDQLGTAYVCLLVELDEETHKYLCVPVSKQRLGRLVDAQIDVRQVVESPETGEAFEGQAINGDLGHIETRAIPLDEIPEHWLPDPGYFLDLGPTPDNRVVEESQERNRAVIHWTLRPPESAEEAKITATHLSEGVELFQQLVTRAYAHCLRHIRAPVREEIASPKNYELEVLAFSGGSFTVHMQTAAQADLVGYSQIARALDIIDALSHEAEDTERALDMLGQYGGSFAAAYKDLLRFVIDNDTPMAYEWSMPQSPHSTRRSISPSYAKSLHEALVRRVDVGVEERTLVGRLSKVDQDRRSWRLVDAEGRGHDGHMGPLSALTLAGVEIETKEYEFKCEERLEVEQATGREHTRLFLISYREL
jgi:hypothetical protein